MRTNRVSHPRSRTPGTVARRQRWRVRPTLMALEDRRLLSTIAVNNPTDTPVVGKIDLRQAIALANTTGGNETITFDKMVFKTPQTITLDPSLGQLDLSDTTGTEAIVGPKVGVTVNAGGKSRVFQVDGGVTASVSGMTITDGSAGSGGGLYNHGGTATLTNCTVSGNDATVTSGYGGGGVYTNASGTTTLTNCTVSGNSSGRDGGGLWAFPGTNILTNCTVSGNTAANLGGGLAAIGNTTTLTNCTVSGNSATYAGGGLFIYGGTDTLTNCTVSGNSATGAFGEGGGVDFAFNTSTLTNCTVNNNSAAYGGGLFTYGGNGSGGGMFVGAAGSATLDQFDVALNLALGGLAGSGGTSGDGIGGGLYVTTGGVVTLKKATVALNFASTSNSNIYGTVTYD